MRPNTRLKRFHPGMARVEPIWEHTASASARPMAAGRGIVPAMRRVHPSAREDQDRRFGCNYECHTTYAGKHSVGSPVVTRLVWLPSVLLRGARYIATPGRRLMVVLLVEDDPIVRSTLADFLEAAGCELLEAENTLAALAVLADPALGIGVLVTDINLGSGDDGLTLAAEVRRRWPGLAIFYVTGSPERLLGRPPPSSERVFLKPFNPEELVTAVLLALRGRRAGCHTAPAMTGS